MRTFTPRAAAAAAGVLGVLVLTLSGAVPAAAANGTEPAAQAAATFPLHHISIQAGAAADAPSNSWWVTVDDGSAAPRMSHSRAVPRNGALSKDAAYTDPAACDIVGGRTSVCWRGWQTVGNEVRVWTTWRGQSCVVIGSIVGDPTRILCGAVPAST